MQYNALQHTAAAADTDMLTERNSWLKTRTFPFPRFATKSNN